MKRHTYNVLLIVTLFVLLVIATWYLYYNQLVTEHFKGKGLSTAGAAYVAVNVRTANSPPPKKSKGSSCNGGTECQSDKCSKKKCT